MLKYSDGKTQVPVIVDGDKVAVGSQVKFHFVGVFPFSEVPDRSTRSLGERP